MLILGLEGLTYNRKCCPYRFVVDNHIEWTLAIDLHITLKKMKLPVIVERHVKKQSNPMNIHELKKAMKRTFYGLINTHNLKKKEQNTHSIN